MYIWILPFLCCLLRLESEVMFKFGHYQRLKSRPVGCNEKDRQDLVCIKGKVCCLHPFFFFFFLRARAVRSLAYQLYFSTVCQCRSQQDTCWAFVYLAALHSLFAFYIYIKRACLSGESGTLRSAIWVCLSTDILASDLFNH